MLPVYRQAPDYETAVREKYYNHANPTREVISNPVLYSSHPDIHSATHLKYVNTFNCFVVACSTRQINVEFRFSCLLQQNNLDPSMYKHYQDPAQADRLLRLENAAVPQVNQVIHTYRYASDQIIRCPYICFIFFFFSKLALECIIKILISNSSLFFLPNQFSIAREKYEELHIF